MGYTKQQIIDGAFEEIGVASRNFDLTPEEVYSALRRLDAMLAEWNAKGIHLGYPVPRNPDDDAASSDATIPSSAYEAAILNLAIRLAPQHGKTLSPDTRISAKAAYNTLLARACVPPEMNLPCSLPMGAGNKGRDINRDTFIPVPESTLDVGTDSILSFD